MRAATIGSRLSGQGTLRIIGIARLPREVEPGGERRRHHHRSRPRAAERFDLGARRASVVQHQPMPVLAVVMDELGAGVAAGVDDAFAVLARPEDLVEPHQPQPDPVVIELVIDPTGGDVDDRATFHGERAGATSHAMSSGGRPRASTVLGVRVAEVSTTFFHSRNSAASV